VANCLYLEWFSELNGRMVIESTDFDLQITMAEWSMSAAEEALQTRESQTNFHAYLDSITGGPDNMEDDEDDDFAEEEEETDDEFNGEAESDDSEDEMDEPEEGSRLLSSDILGDSSLIEVNIEAEEEMEPLNEFEWEQELREADRRAEAYQEAFDRYRDHPQRERLIAEAMGWEPEEVEDFREDWQDVTESMQPQDPDEMLENAGQFTDDDEGSHHPLSRRAMDFALRLQRDAKGRGLFDGDLGRDNPVLSVIVNIIALGGKLAAALDGTMHGFDPEPGFIIAMLKRAQVPLNEAMHALSSIQLTGLPKDTRAWLIAARTELFELRKDILDLMSDLRK
jgi:lambda repressor-like predicted transcriptional regulator